MKELRIIFTGGHHNSALEVAKTMRLRRPGTKFLWLGHKHTMLHDKSLSGEYREVTAAGFEFKELKAGKLSRQFKLIYWARIPYGFLQALYYVMKFRPNLIVSFGGYLAVPVVIAGSLFGVPVVTHEQTTVVGIANRLIGRFAKKIFLTWESSAVYFDPKKTVYTGLPLRQAFRQNNPDLFRFNNDKPTIYISGGKQGSHRINEAVKEVLQEILGVANVIHQVGSTTTTDDFKIMKELRESLPPELQERYVVRDYVFEPDIGSVFARANLVVSRSGAHIVYELAVLGKPCILIPLPNTSHDEQARNAKLLEENGLARIIPQADLTPTRIIDEIKMMLKNISEYMAAGEKFKKTILSNGTDKVIEEIEKVVQNWK